MTAAARTQLRKVRPPNSRDFYQTLHRPLEFEIRTLRGEVLEALFPISQMAIRTIRETITDIHMEAARWKSSG
jgi:hypothetical protein